MLNDYDGIPNASPRNRNSLAILPYGNGHDYRCFFVEKTIISLKKLEEKNTLLNYVIDKI
jgi:hypothetical protein